MRNAGGYGQLICDGPVVARDRFGRALDQEHDTFGCSHCGAVVMVNAGEKAADIGGYCRSCDKLICGPCVDADRCRPVEKLLEAIERRRAVEAYS